MIRALAFAATLFAPALAAAFCGFFVSGADANLYNDASQVVLMRSGTRTIMTMSNNYKGPPTDFAMVVPVPVVLQKEQVKTLPHDVFDHIDQLSAPRLVEYWEQDPCYVPEPEPEMVYMRGAVAMAPAGAAMDDDEMGVRIEARFAVGEYQILILSAQEANGLEAWLRLNKYRIPDGAAGALAPYIAEGSKFFVAKVDIKKVKRDAKGTAVLSPLRFDYESNSLRLPVRLGLLNAKGKQDLLIYLLHPSSRFEVANYPNVFIPSNLEVEDEVRHRFGQFYTSLFDATMIKAGGKAVITEYAWQTSGCDPCPVPPLQPSDLYTLGGDVLGEGAPGERQTVDRNQPFFGNASSWVLTRMHTRYDQKTLSEDLVFVEAGPVTGGRGSEGAEMEPPGGVQTASVNNFQGRYIIRHYWRGPVKCDHPVFGRWGGPPEGGEKMMAAGGLGSVERADVPLAKVVRSTLPQLGLPGKRPPKRPKQKK
ncbi:MAG: DUF2330 domain-containing protein [Myxococcales bacterium]|nr:DUF2330 domain-containing protein [Myxococcales bacterium]